MACLRRRARTKQQQRVHESVSIPLVLGVCLFVAVALQFLAARRSALPPA